VTAGIIVAGLFLGAVMFWRLLSGFANAFVMLIYNLTSQPQTPLGKLIGISASIGLCYGLLRFLQWAVPA
jgi:hypothetical protein